MALAEVSEIYASGAWGPNPDFDSGSGSRGAAAEAYQALARELIEETGARRAVDIGCGEFRVASGFVDSLESYVGVDVVPRLIDRNTAKFGRPGVRFILLDESISDLPHGDI